MTRRPAVQSLRRECRRQASRGFLEFLALLASRGSTHPVSKAKRESLKGSVSLLGPYPTSPPSMASCSAVRAHGSCAIRQITRGPEPYGHGMCQRGDASLRAPTDFFVTLWILFPSHRLLILVCSGPWLLEPLRSRGAVHVFSSRLSRIPGTPTDRSPEGHFFFFKTEMGHFFSFETQNA